MVASKSSEHSNPNNAISEKLSKRNKLLLPNNKEPTDDNNVKNSEKPSFKEIINNLTNRTEKIKMNIKTTTGKKIAKKQLKIISKFLKNYKKFI